MYCVDRLKPQSFSELAGLVDNPNHSLIRVNVT
jgi:hypothetical protein